MESSSAGTSDLEPSQDASASANEVVPSATQSEAPRAETEAWGTGDDEDGWMPKPARLHSGRTRSCAVCFASLQYSAAASWDEYLQSEEYLRQLQANVLQDAFISSLICGENTAGDLPTEHRMHKNRKLKCRQSVADYRNMTSAGVVDKSGMEKGSIRTLEEMLIEALPTPVFTHVLERRLAVISHSSEIACELMSHDGVKKIPRPVESAPGNEELHHLAIHTLGALLGAFDYDNPQALRSFEELSQLLTCFPVLSLYSFWSPTKKPPDKALLLEKDAVDATSSSDSHREHLRSTELGKVTSIAIHWHMKFVPQTVGVLYRPEGSESFVQLVDDRTVSPSGPTHIEVSFPASCQEARIVMSGTPSSNRNGTYAIQHLRLNMPAPDSLFADPKSTLSAIAHWLLGALEASDEAMAAEAIGALRAWALSTASLNVTMLFVDMLLRLNTEGIYGHRRTIAALALEQGRLLLKGIRAYHREEEHQLAHDGDKVGFGDVRRVAALFESSVCSTGVLVEDGGLVVRTRETSYQYAAVSCGISSGKASWKFRLDTDTQDDEMTCFGAAILPVTVNGYDSSPSLWMLRGYNGNLYARGHKLNRTIGKVHPGDIVQVDVDMGEGTLAYKINGTDYGVVFTDLAGHEVHPAVSFYGSGKVITLLGVTKWDCAGSGPADIDPVFLSSMREYHFSVGYGTLGKGGQLGYASNGDSNASPGNASATGSTSIHINGEAKQRCLSTHPPSHGDAYVIYDLSEAYHMISGAVAINDDTHNEILQNRGASLVFKILGDDKLLWQSKQMSETHLIEQFEVDVKDVRMLELNVSCSGSNHCAHAVWVDPCLHPVEEWACSKCAFVNRGSSKVCSVCRNGTRDESSTSVAVVTSEDVSSESVSPALIVSGDAVQNSESLNELGSTIISQIYGLYQFQSEHSSVSISSAKSSVQFEEPFCRQPSKEVFSLMLAILKRFHTQCIAYGADADAEHARDGCVHVLGIISANLESIECHDVKDPASELGVSSELVADLRSEIEAIARIREENETPKKKLAEDIEKAAAQTIVTGISVLYPSAIEKLELLLQLLRLHMKRPFDVTSASYFVLASVMKLLAAPGPDGILTFMPFMAAEVAKSRGARFKESDEASWLSAITETVKLLMQVVVNAHRKQLATDTDRTSHESALNDDGLSDIAIRLLKTYQLYLLSEAVELTKTNAIENDPASPRDASELKAMLQRRLQVQESTIQFGFLSLNAYRDLVDSIVAFQAEESFLLSQAAAARQASVRSYNIPLLSEVLPWFVSSLCLLRRQTWLARPILPAVVRLLETLDHYCSESQIVSKSAHRFQELESHQKARLIESQEMERAVALERDPSFRSHTSKRLYNVFHQLYTGEKDHFEGQIGFQFEATSSFIIVALGRSVNPTRHGGRLTREHTIRLWEEGSQLLVAQVTVGGSSKKDALGYALEMLPTPAKITQGKLYRLTTQEFANGGDPWYKKENLPDEEYDESFIKILRDCYASGSVGFPGSQNMMGAAYGVPTFMVQDETPLASLPRFVPPHGCLSLRFNTKKKLNSVCISHTGTSAYVKDGTDTWRTCLLRTAFLHGVHSVDFALKCSRAGGTVSGHVCIGIDWRQPRGNSLVVSSLSAYETFVGETSTSIGWMPSIGAIWVKGTRYDYGPKLSVAAGDIFTVTIDYDLQLLSFAYNGKNIGVAVGPREFQPLGTTIEGLPEVVTAGVSLYGSQDVVQVRPSGIAKSTLRIHWLFDLHNSLASLAGRITSTLIAGHPVDGVEEELLPWLQSPLLSGGIAEASAGQDQSTSLPLRWSEAMQAECTRYPSNDQAAGTGVLTGISQNTPSIAEKDSVFRDRGSGGRLEATEAVSQRDPAFWKNWTADMTERGTVQLIMSWLEKHCPDRTFLSRLGRFPSCERWMCAALIMHAPSHVLQEVQAIGAGAGASAAGEVVGAEFFLAHANLTPSDDLIRLWKRIIMLRHWLIKARQEYRAKEADEPSLDEQEQVESSPKQESASPTKDQRDDTTMSKRLSDEINLEQSVVMPRTFDDLVLQVIQRAEFLCKLAPPSEEAERLKGDSQIALFNLAEKWSAQKTPPSLQPMLERWKTLSEADSSKWSGIVDVLRAQHRWRARRASIQGLAIPTSAVTSTNIESENNEDVDGSDDLLLSKKYDYTNSFSAMMKACELYVRDGTGAPPEVLAMLLERRQRRSDSRLIGLQAMKSIISLLSYDSTIHNALIFLRPAMRGFTESEKESRELNDGQVVAETFRATVRHHYLKGLEGCNRQTIQSVQSAFCDLYAYLAQLLGGSSGCSVSDPQLKQTILCAWSLDFEPRDHQFLLDTGMLPKLQEIFSISSVLREAVADNDCSSCHGLSRSSSREYSSINWHPLSEEFVQQGLLRSGYMTKRDVIRLLRRAPHYACPAGWWKKNELDVESPNDAVPITARHTASSLSLLYTDMLAGLQRKLLGPPPRTPTSKALLFGAKITPTTGRSPQAPANPKPEEISYVEMPALGEVQDFTMEMWIFPTELVACQALRCDNGVQNGSVYLELIDRHLQLSIPGNSPRERLFRSYQFRTFEWTHCAVTYDTNDKCVQLFVNGTLVEKMSFEHVCSSVNFRDSRLGCWMSGVDAQGAALTNISAQRKFKGSITEVRMWRVSRSCHDILHDFQRSVPLVKLPTGSTLAKSQGFSKDMIGLWHLTEGEGICGYDCAPVLKAATEGPEARGYNLTISHCRWVHTSIPVFGNDALDNMSPNEWSQVMVCIRSFQRKVRSWLTTQFNESVRLSKLVCEHDERLAIQKWSQLSRLDDDDDDMASGSDDAYTSGEQTDLDGLSGANSKAVDATTSTLLSQWSACTDEQMIVRKQTRRCAWVVFRFLASTGISGAYERREGEAKSVAAVAKLKRKQRLQKAGSSGNVMPAVRGAEVSRAPSTGFTDEDVAARTAEAASDAAKSAATNRELEEPVLQTLWFSKEFHRKVFEVLEKELIQGKELTDDAEGLTRAQRMLRSVSTPLQKRGASLRQYPSDVARGKLGFVNVHHAPSDLSADSELLEPLEVETHMFGVLLFMLSQSQQAPAITYLVRPHMLRGLLEMLRLASPRSQRVVKLLLRRICCSGSVKPSDVGAILGSESVLIDLLLDQVAESVCSTAAPMPTHAVNVPPSSTLVGSADRDNAMASTESLSNPIGFRSGQISLVMASESVALLRRLLMEKQWQQGVAETLCNAIRNITPILLARKKSGPPSPDVRASADPSDIRFRAAIVLSAQGSGNSGTDVNADGSGQSVSATLIEMNSQASTVRVVFHPTSSEIDFDPGHNVQDVKPSSLSPTEELCLPPTAVPLTLDMMPVILQLASLDETSVMKDFDSLWRLQIRSRALLALEALLRHSHNVTKSFAHDTLTQSLLRFALTPISLNSFLGLPLLQERGRMILCRLIESSTPLGEAMFHGLEEPTAPTLAASEATNSVGIEVNDDPAEEETEGHRVRRGFASTLAAMGFEFDLCMAALEHARDDPNLAVEWLMGDGAATYQERQEAQRLARASIAAHELAEGAEGTPGLTLEAKATELQNISGMPFCLAFCALELSNNDPNRAMEWLMEHGSNYAEKFDSLDLLTDAFSAARTVVLEDRAAMEEIDQPDPLVTTSGRQDAIAAEYLGSAASTRRAELLHLPNVDAMAVTLAPILAPGPVKPISGAAVTRDISMAAFSPLDPKYLTPNVLLTVTSDIGPVQRLATSGRTGIYRSYSPDDGVLITFLNTESGAYEDEWHFPRDLRRIVSIYDEPLEGVESIHRVALRTENALSTHYARRAITALLCAFDSVGSSTPRIAIEEGQGLQDKPPVVSSSFSYEILSVLGGPRQFVSLLKMVAASEMNSIQHTEIEAKGVSTARSTADGRDKSSAAITEQPVALLVSLQAITLRMLREEARTEMFANSELNSYRPRIGSPKRAPSSDQHGSASASGGEYTISHSVPGVPEYSEDDDEDEALSRAIALSIEESLPPPAPATTEEKFGDWFHEESKSEGSSRYMRSTRQPSDTEAQEVASAYLGGGIDDHDGLLSSVLVQECVTHFVESTRMAGDGAGEALAVQEFQSLHPYFGRCEYARAVSIDSSYRCLRIVFDHRCRLGPKGKLTFFADPECEDRVGVVDHAMTTSGHLLPDLIIHSHQFWFRFTASEENATKDNGYGYRFQVKPMANIRWTKESEVLASPSLEWACWVLELLLNDATELVAHGAVHNRKIYGALVRYLRSPGAPFKGRVVRLLQQLLHRPELFPGDEVPELDALESISRLALTRAEVDRASGKVFLSAHLLQVVELSMMISSASSVFKRKMKGDSAASAPLLTAPFDFPVPFERKRARDSLNDISELTRFLLGQTARLSQHVLVAIWLEVYGSSTVIETSHPYAPGTPLSGHVGFEDAQALRITFDSRCSLAPGQGQGMSRLDLASFMLVPREDGSGEPVKEIRSNRTYAGESGWPEGAISHDGNNLEYSFHADENAGAHFGFAATVNALGIPKEKQLSRATVTDVEQLLLKIVQQQAGPDDTSEGDRWTQAMDLQLVDWVNNHVEPAASLPSATPATTRRSVDLQPADIKLDQTLDGLRCSQLLDLSLESLQLRFALLKYLNLSLQHCLSLLDLRDTKSPWTIAHRLRQLSHCIFFDVKSALVEAAVEATNILGEASGGSQQQTARITLDRMQALESRDDREVEPSVSECFFAQAFRQLHAVDPALLRRQIDSKGRLFSVKFRGEEGVDWGGVYREGATSMVDDLFSPHFSLFVLCPNGQHDTGNNRGMYLPNPKCTSPVAMQMFAFVGQLLGISLRTHGDFPFMLPSLVWKQLLGQSLTRADLEGTDAMFIQMLDGIANCENDGISTEEEFAIAFAGLELRFTASSCTGEEIELVPGGRHLTVEFHNRSEYCRLAERARLEECSVQVAAMARGFATLFPRRVLTLLTWQELEILACGSPKIDLDLWQRHTRYDGYAEDDPTVLLFWEALAEFSDEQRADFVRFAWGRSRLPRGKWSQPFKLSKKGGRDATRSLPVAHTCFFSVELPPYMSLETMRSMLLATITFGLGGILMA
ncbi:regulator of chromosome condensation [Phytophthora pseudosyringae]|uniref:Regulator of chromosome condensation n=1 Tax=Phytophthora pseudosyringae TaxID=221518 RepID=A0A8T1VMZ1_9STRA|nr:regulator of chromosome condensation [Phytophthora pseudosyringae]